MRRISVQALRVSLVLAIALASASAQDFENKKRRWLRLLALGAEIGQIKACMQAYAQNGTPYEMYWPAFNHLAGRVTHEVLAYLRTSQSAGNDPSERHHAWEAVIRAQLEAEAAHVRGNCANILDKALGEAAKAND